MKKIKRRRKRGEGCIHKPPDTVIWHYSYSHNGKRYGGTSGSPDRRVAEKLLKGMLARRTLGQLIPGTDRITFEDMATDVTNDYKVNGKKSFNRMVDSLDHLKSYFGGYKAQAITTVMGPVGPEACAGVPPNSAAKKPTKIAPYRPAMAPAPEATPNARANGRATTAATSPP